MKNEKGWLTLIELLIVLVIIGILLGIFLPRYLGRTSSEKGVPSIAMERAKGVECMNNLRSIRQAIEMFRTEQEQPPSSLDQLIPSYGIPDSSFLKCPVGGEDYIYDPYTGNISCPHPGHEKY